jgi:hypothetical protein
MIIYNYLTYVNYFNYINVFGDGSIMKRRYQRLKGIQRSKLPKRVIEFQVKADTED